MERRDSSPAIERRLIPSPTLRMETRAEGEKPRMIGHASVFNSWTTLYQGRNFVWRERVNPGAYTRAIREMQDVRCLFNHDPNFILGRTKSGTLELAEDATGLVSDCDPSDTQLIRDLVLSPIGRGDISQMSFAFTPNNRDKSTVVSEGGTTIIDRGGERITIRMEGDVEVEERELIDLDLYDVSPVTYPAYEDTDVGLRSRGQRRDSEIRERLTQAPRTERGKVLATLQRRLWLANGHHPKGLDR